MKETDFVVLCPRQWTFLSFPQLSFLSASQNRQNYKAGLPFIPSHCLFLFFPPHSAAADKDWEEARLDGSGCSTTNSLYPHYREHWQVCAPIFTSLYKHTERHPPSLSSIYMLPGTCCSHMVVRYMGSNAHCLLVFVFLYCLWGLKDCRGRRCENTHRLNIFVGLSSAADWIFTKLWEMMVQIPAFVTLFFL